MYEELKIQHLAGPLQIDLPPSEAVVLCVVKNGENYIDEFIDHYRSMGFSHIAFLDNGSEDATVTRASRHKNVTVLLSRASFKEEKLGMKHALMRLFGVGTWSLVADIDEFFQYPFMDRLPLDSFIQYLNANRFTSVVAHMMDMVPDRTLDAIVRENITSIRSTEWFFDYDNIEKKPYFVRTNSVSNPDIQMWYGGIRERLFNVSPVFLTKHPMNFGDGKLLVYSSHTMGNRRVADISALILHYKFIGDIRSRVDRAVREQNYYRNSREYQYYSEAIRNHGDLRFTLPSSVQYQGHETMLQHGMFNITNQYKCHVSRYQAEGREASVERE